MSVLTHPKEDTGFAAMGAADETRTFGAGFESVPARTAIPRTFLMCAPEHFDVVYEINPWMDMNVPVDREAALQQWNTLRETYLSHGHTVYSVRPQPGLPDMVYAANGGLVIDGQSMAPKFAFPEREAEGPAYGSWFCGATRAGVMGDTGRYVGQSEELNEGEGDTLLIGDLLLCGTGFRTSVAAHAELAERMGLAERGIEVVTLELVDPRFYHLDTALTVLDDGAISGERTIAYLPQAFSPNSQELLAELFPNAIIADEFDAAAFGLNAVSDGKHVYLNAGATGMIRKLAERGFEPVPIDISEILKGGGSVKCCTLFIRPSAEG